MVTPTTLDLLILIKVKNKVHCAKASELQKKKNSRKKKFFQRRGTYNKQGIQDRWIFDSSVVNRVVKTI